MSPELRLFQRTHSGWVWRQLLAGRSSDCRVRSTRRSLAEWLTCWWWRCRFTPRTGFRAEATRGMNTGHRQINIRVGVHDPDFWARSEMTGLLDQISCTG